VKLDEDEFASIMPAHESKDQAMFSSVVLRVFLKKSEKNEEGCHLKDVEVPFCPVKNSAEM